jgi:hypothetical protein
MFRLSLLAHFSPGATTDNDSRLSINLGLSSSLTQQQGL